MNRERESESRRCSKIEGEFKQERFEGKEKQIGEGNADEERKQ